MSPNSANAFPVSKIVAPQQAAAGLLRDLAELLPAKQVSLINPLVHTNASQIGDPAYRRFLFWINTARDVAQPAVRLGRYPPQTFIDGAGPFHVLTDAVLVTDHVVPGFTEMEAWHARLLAARDQAITVWAPCVFACHPGVNVWSHWLIDTLPRILLSERSFPGKFVYAVPATITDAAPSSFLARSVCDSLSAYGIASHRLLRLRAGTIYRFDALFDIVGLAGDGMHPGVLDELRRIIPPPDPREAQRILAAMRGPGNIRPVTNPGDLDAVLRRHNAAAQDPAGTPFTEKLQAFSAADVIVGDLGSNLAMSIYAKPDAGLVTTAPAGWRDNYFAQIYQRLDVRHADIRGVPQPRPGDAPGHHAYELQAAHLAAGIEAARAAKPIAARPILVDGRPIARAPGAIRLRIDFGEDGNATSFQRGDFSPPEGRHAWSLGPRSTLLIPCFGRNNPGDIWLEIKGIGFIAPPRLISRPLAIAANGSDLAEFDTDELTHLHVFLPHDLVARAADLTIEFRHPICPSPRSLGVSADARPLGFMFEFVALRSAKPL